MSRRLEQPDAINEVTLVCMPWQASNLASNGLSTIKSLLDESDIKTHVEYFNMKFQNTIGEDKYNMLSTAEHSGELIFVPSAFGITNSIDDIWLNQATSLFKSETNLDRDEFLLLAREIIPTFIEECVAQVVENGSKIAGLTLTYQQLLTSLAFTRRLAEVKPDINCIFGGFGAWGESGIELIRKCLWVDAVFTGEISKECASVFEHMLDGSGDYSTPGLAYRTSENKIMVNPNIETAVKLDNLPTPNFDDFVVQKENNSITGETWLSFEASRGCWWGDQRLCSFCGLNGPNTAFREKSVDNLVQELEQQYAKHKVFRFSSADNIMSFTQRDELLKKLSGLREKIGNLIIYYQIKSNLDRDGAQKLRDAGVQVIQPGIEAFDDRLLSLCRKGASLRNQLLCLKYLAEQDIQIIYGLLFGIVGESADDYQNQLKVIRKIKHLPPPEYFSPILFDRYSHYHKHPELYGIESFPVPKSMYLLFPEWDPKTVSRVAQTFEPKFKQNWRNDDALKESIDLLRTEIKEWKRQYQPGTLTFSVLEDNLIEIVDNRDADLTCYRLNRDESALFLACEHSLNISKLPKRLGWTKSRIKSVLATLDKKRIVYRQGSWVIALPLLRAKRLVVGLMGNSCSGKTTLCELCNELGAQVVDVGEIFRRELGDEFWALPPTIKLEKIGNRESIFHFVAPFVQRALKNSDVVFIDSLKAKEDLRVLNKLISGAEIIALRIEASEQLRDLRFSTRKRPGDEPTLLLKEKRLNEIGIEILFSQASHNLVNEGSIEDLKMKLNQFLSVLRPNWIVNNGEIRKLGHQHAVPGRE